ncbi:hypothetical protein FNV43_RR02250 [Rhamnella rubrinervis]|nr:hypothetical protein FNV43_RR02250 [Rhamnella rubrinervis]
MCFHFPLASASTIIPVHAYLGSPYAFGLVGVDHNLDFPKPMPVICMARIRVIIKVVLFTVLETVKTYSSEDGLAEEALVTNLRTCRHHHLFLHTSLGHSSSGSPVTELLSKFKELYGLDDEIAFRTVTMSSENRPRALTLGTATQIGYTLFVEDVASNFTGLPVL